MSSAGLPDAISEFGVYRGRVGLCLLLRALGVGAGDSVAIQAFTCIAVPEAIAAAGATPVYVDIEAHGLNMDPASLRRTIDSRVKAVIVQHSFGIPADVESILQAAGAAAIPVIEDCCHSHSSRYHGQPIGTFGVGAFRSYEWGKPVPLGIGGTLTVNDPAVRRKVATEYESLRAPGAVRAAKVAVQALAFEHLFTPSRYWMVKGAYRFASRLRIVEGSYTTDAAGTVSEDFSLRMLPRVWTRHQRDSARLADAFAGQSRRIAREYCNGIRSARVRHLAARGDADTVFVRYPLLVDDKPRLLARAREARVEVADWYATPVHPLPADSWSSAGYPAGSCPVAEHRCSQFVSLPVHAKVRAADVSRTIDMLNAF
jgi:dTDP-4-amino-4,6-dideoxygalactose transaminase